MSTFDETLALYDYPFPPELIAVSPTLPRENARLLVHNRATGETSFTTFFHIAEYLPKNTVLVFNRTKVIPARIHLTKGTGGVIEALYLEKVGNAIRVMASGKMNIGDGLAWKDGYSFMVMERDGKYATLKPSFPLDDLYQLLDRYGETPLPPYIKNSPLTEADRRREYQTVYAKDAGSVAAPTAGLHFTPALIETIEKLGCTVAYVTLHVNLGTFAPLTEEHVAQKKLHEEYFEIDTETAALLNKAKAEGRPIIAVGTTTVRTLESAARIDSLPPLDGVQTPWHGVSTVHLLRGLTDIFIDEHDQLNFVDGLITNFHVPKSSLLMLVSAFTGREKLLDLYRQAIEKKFKLFSFGDGMLIF